MVAVGSLILLIAVIILGMVTKKNVGVIGLLAAYLYGIFVVGMKAKEIYSGGFPVTVFFLIMSTTFMFGIANANGTTEIISKNVAVLSRGNNKIVPWLFFLVGAILAGIGGSMLIMVVIMPIAYSVCLDRKLNVTMVAIITMGGCMIGGLSPIVLNGIVASSLAAENGVPNYFPMWAAYAVVITILCVFAYIVFGGYKAERSADIPESIPLNRNQTITLIAIVVVCVSVIFLKQDVGLVCCAVAAVLLLFNFCDQKAAVNSIPWNTLLLITGMSILLNVVDTAGGITVLTDALSNVITPVTGQPVMIVMGGLLGAVSSGTGVAMPTLIPLAANLAAANPSLDAFRLILAVVVGINSVVLSPFSTVGALACGCAPKGVDVDKLFRQLLLTAVCFIIFEALLGFVGFFKIFG